MKERIPKVCRECHFWKIFEQEGQQDLGQCRSHPPRHNPLRYKFYVKRDEAEGRDVEIALNENIEMPDAWSYPITMEFQWCGEFKQRNPDEAFGVEATEE